MPSIGLISPTRRKRSVILNVPVSLDGNSGFQFIPRCQRYDWWSPCTSPTNTSATIVAPTGPNRSPFLRTCAKNVIPERCPGMQIMLPRDLTIRTGRNLFWRQRLRDLHRRGHALSAGEAEYDATAEIAER